MSAIINFRKLLEVNFLLFMSSLYLGLKTYNEFIIKSSNMFSVFDNIQASFKFALVYVFFIVVCTPATKLLLLLHYAIFSNFKSFRMVIDFLFSDKESIALNKDFASFDEFEKVIAQSGNKFLSELYWKRKEEYESEQFGAKLSLSIVILFFIDCLSPISPILKIFDYNSFIESAVVIIISGLVCIKAYLYITDNRKYIYKNNYRKYFDDYEKDNILNKPKE